MGWASKGFLPSERADPLSSLIHRYHRAMALEWRRLPAMSAITAPSVV